MTSRTASSANKRCLTVSTLSFITHSLKAPTDSFVLEPRLCVVNSRRRFSEALLNRGLTSDIGSWPRISGVPDFPGGIVEAADRVARNSPHKLRLRQSAHNSHKNSRIIRLGRPTAG